MSIYRQIVRHSAMYSFGVVLVRATSFLLLPIYTRYLKPADYGVMELLDLTTNVLVLLLGMRLGDALAFFYFSTEDTSLRKKLVSTAFIGTICIGVLGGSLAILASPQISRLTFGSAEQAKYFRLVFCTLMCNIPLEVGLSYLRILKKSHLLVMLQLTRATVAVICTVYFLVFLRYGIMAPLLSSLISSSVALSVVASGLLWRVGIHVAPSILKRQVAYAFPVGLAGVGMLFIHYGDRLFLVKNAPLAQLGIYGLGYKMGMLVSYMFEPFANHWNSQVYDIVKEKDGSRIYVRVFTHAVLGMTVIAISLTLFCRPLLKVMVANDFYSAHVFIPPIAFAYVLLNSGVLLRRAFYIQGKTSWEAIVTLTASVTCIGLYLSLIPTWKAWGAVASTFLTFSMMLVVSYIWAQKAKAFSFELGRLVRIVVAAGITVALYFMSSGITDFWMQVAIGAGCLALFFGLLLGSGFLTVEERRTILHILQRFRGPETAGTRP